MQEKRRFNRCRINEKAKIKKENYEQEGKVFDISIGGMGILFDKEIGVGSKISGKFKIAANLSPFFVQGEVAWIKPYLDQQGSLAGYAVGIKFTKVSTLPFV